MAYAPSKDEIDQLTDDQVAALYDAHAVGTVVGSGFYLDELTRRRLAQESRRMTDMTQTMKSLTWAIFGLTVVNLIVVAYQTFK